MRRKITPAERFRQGLMEAVAGAGESFSGYCRLAAQAMLQAAMGRRMLAEERVHVEHCDMWMRRLGASAGEAHDRIQAACDKLAHDAAMLFEPTEGVDQLEAAGIYPHCEGDMFARWEQALRAIAEPAGVRLSLRRPAAGDKGGRRGQHCPGFDGMLNELCEVYRIEPQAAW